MHITIKLKVFKVLFETSFILNISDVNENISTLDLPVNGVLCLKVNKPDELLSLASKIYSSSIKTKFFICVDPDLFIDSITTNMFFEHITTILFHYNYFKNEVGWPVLGWATGYDNSSFDKLKFNLVDKVRKSGYENISFLKLPYEEMIIWKKDGIILNREDTVSDFSDVLKRRDYIFDHLFIKIDQISCITVIISEMQNTENFLLDNHPQIYRLLKGFSDTKIENARLFRKAKSLSQRLDSLKSYSSFYNPSESNVRNRISEIVNFYNREYEVLPDWYKKFGHIIKVLIGKRTFRSLFNDNVKKYKD